MLFISYARADDEPFARWLYEGLTGAGFDVFRDRESMSGRGRTYLHDLTDAITRTDRVLLVTGPNASASDSVGKEWKFALEHCIPVVPIVRIGDRENVPRELAKLHSVDFRAKRDERSALAELLRIVAEPVAALGVTPGVPPLPGHVLERKSDVEAVRDAVLVEAMTNAVVSSYERASAIIGMGGLGKSVLATLFANSCDARRFFHDGIFWVALGRSPDLIAAMRRFGLALGVRFGSPGTQDAAQEMASVLQQHLSDRQALLVLDDVWDARDTQPFRSVLGPRCQLLMTSRSVSVATALRARVVPIQALDDDTSLELLARSSGQARDALPAEAGAIVRQTAGLPLALSLVGSMVGPRRDRWRHALRRLELADLEAFRNEFPDYPHPSLFAAIDVSVEALEPALRDFYLELAVFPRAQLFPESAALRLWTGGARDALEGETALDTLVKRSLLRYEESAGYRLHDLQHDYVVSRSGDPASLHGRLLDSYMPAGNWTLAADDGYLFDHLLHHLRAAHRHDVLHDLMSGRPETPTHGWYQVRAAQTGVFSFLQDLRVAREDASELANREVAVLGSAPSVGAGLRYTLIETSVRSAASTVPSALVHLYVDRGLVTPVQAADAVRAMANATDADARRKIAALLELARHGKTPARLAASLRKEAYGLIREYDPARRTWLFAHATQVAAASDLDALHELFSVLPEAQLATAQRMLSVALARCGRSTDALAMLVAIADDEERGEALHHALAHLDREALESGLSMTLALTKSRDRALVGAVAGLARTGQIQRALELSAVISGGSYRAAALTALAPFLDNVDARRGMEIAKEIESFPDSVAAQAILAERLDPEERAATIAELDRAASDRYDRDAEYASNSIIPHLDRQTIESRLWTADAHEAVPLLTRLAALGHADVAMRNLASFENESQRRNALEQFAPYLDRDQVHDALELPDRFADAHDREFARTALAVRVAELGDGQTALRIADRIESGVLQKDALMRIAPNLDAADLTILRMRFSRIGDDDHRDVAIAQLASWSPEPWLASALTTLRRGISDDAVLVTALDRMAEVLEPHQIEHVYEALVSDREGTVYGSKVALLLLPALEADLRAHALSRSLSAHWDNGDSGFLLKTLARWMPDIDPTTEAQVRMWASDYFEFLLQLLEIGRTAANPLARILGVDAVLQHAHAIQHERHRTGVLASLIPFLEGGAARTLEDTVLHAIGQWTNPYDIVISLGEHAPHLTDRLLTEVVAQLRARCEPENVRTEIAALARRAAIRSTSEALELLGILRTVASGPDENVIKTMATIAEHVPPSSAVPMLHDAIDQVARLANGRTGGGGFARTRAACLASLCSPLLRLSLEDAEVLMARLLDGLSQYPRPECVADLAALGPVIHRIGGAVAVHATCAALHDTAVWWP